MMMQDWNAGWGGRWVGPIFWIGLLVLLIVAVVALVRRAGDGGRIATRARRPRDILDERFAKGEIDQAEYESRRKALDG